MIENCLKDATIVAVCKSSQNKNPQISELSYKALEKMISLIGQNITQLQPITFKDVFRVVIFGLEGKRQETQKSSENLVKFIFQFLGDENFGTLVQMLLNEGVIDNKGIEKLKKVFEQKESKNKGHLADVLKQQRIMKTNEKFQNYGYNDPNSQQPMMNNNMSMHYQQSNSFGGYPTQQNFR